MAGTTDQDVIALLETDHREFEGLFAEFEAASAEERADIVATLIRGLVIHSEAEELVVYPAMRNSVPDGDRLYEESLREHREAEELMAQIDRISADNVEVPSLVQRLKSAVEHHVADEESQVFPMMRQHMDASMLRTMAGTVEVAKRAVPTRPHPSAPDTPPGAALGGPVLGIIDRVRDAARSAIQGINGKR